MASTYNVTTDTARGLSGASALDDDEAIEAVSDDALYAPIDYYELCKNAEDDGIDPSAIKTLLERLSVTR